jgi:hypothetical protein
MFATQDSSWGSVSYSCAKRQQRRRSHLPSCENGSQLFSPKIEKGGQILVGLLHTSEDQDPKNKN